MSKPTQAQAEIQAAFDAFQPDAIQLEYVQVRIGEVTTCATIADTWRTADGVDFYKLNLLVPYVGPAHFPTVRVRPCSGVDGRCFCSDEPLQPMSARSTVAEATEGPRLRGCGAQADARSAPLGNHGDNNLPATPASVSASGSSFGPAS